MEDIFEECPVENPAHCYGDRNMSAAAIRKLRKTYFKLGVQDFNKLAEMLWETRAGNFRKFHHVSLRAAVGLDNKDFPNARPMITEEGDLIHVIRIDIDPQVVHRSAAEIRVMLQSRRTPWSASQLAKLLNISVDKILIDINQGLFLEGEVRRDGRKFKIMPGAAAAYAETFFFEPGA